MSPWLPISRVPRVRGEQASLILPKPDPRQTPSKPLAWAAAKNAHPTARLSGLPSHPHQRWPLHGAGHPAAPKHAALCGPLPRALSPHTASHLCPVWHRPIPSRTTEKPLGNQAHPARASRRGHPGSRPARQQVVGAQELDRRVECAPAVGTFLASPSLAPPCQLLPSYGPAYHGPDCSRANRAALYPPCRRALRIARSTSSTPPISPRPIPPATIQSVVDLCGCRGGAVVPGPGRVGSICSRSARE